jgi:2-oxoisovalerate dehydrogenase E1 component
MEMSQAARWRNLRSRFYAYVAEAHPFALEIAQEALHEALEDGLPHGGEAAGFDAEVEQVRPFLGRRLLARLEEVKVPDPLETTPGVPAKRRLEQEARRVAEDCDGFFRREAIALSITVDERREILAGMIITRAVDNRLKNFFLGSDVRWGDKAFQGKGFRSLGQEAIYAAPLRFRRGEAWRGEDGGWQGDLVAPMIRDLGAALAMGPDPDMVRRVLATQMAKDLPPMRGRDLHIGDFARGVLPPAAPLAISALNVAGLAFAMAREGRQRVAVAFIGEGGTSLGEWHEAINTCAVARLPAIFCVQNNQTALSTPVRENCAARVFADKALGYGIPGVTLDGTDPEAIAAAFGWAAERARAGLGPTLIELVCLRICGHAHHDDMLYLGKEQSPGWEYPELHPNGYADREAFDYWSKRDPLARYAERLEAEGAIGSGDFEAWKNEAEEMVASEARTVIAAPWPDGAGTGEGVFSTGPAEEKREPLAERPTARLAPGLPDLDAGAPFDPRGRTFLEAIMLGLRDALRADERVFLYGEDVGGDYGNAFLLVKPLLAEFPGRILNSTLSESATLGVAVGAAIGGLRPIAEIQFNDFVATGFNQLVNNAAKLHYRWGFEAGISVPMVVRMPWGGLRSAGPFHSQNTEPWFYRVPGLKIVAPSTPEDARALLLAAVADPDPVLFYEHIGLYRDPRIKQQLGEEAPAPLPLGKAALRRQGGDLAIVSYGAYVHIVLRVAETLAQEGIEAAVLDLRSLQPLDRESLLRVAMFCGRVLIVHEDSRRGGIGESLAAIVQEEAFEFLDAPVRIVGALDTPVPYSPPLEKAFLPSEEEILQAARLLAAF